MEQEPPTETYTYVGSKKVGFCDKCKQEIYELGSFEGKRFSHKPEGLDWLRSYVRKKLEDSGVIPKDALYELTERIVHRALRDGTYKTHDYCTRDEKGGWKLVKGNFACIESADREIEWAIKYPPPPISRTRFSLKAFVDLK